MKLGVFSNTIKGDVPEEVAARSAALGVEAVQLRLDWPGLDLRGKTEDRTRVRRAYEAVGIEVAALAAYANLLDPNAERRAANRAAVEESLRYATELGTRVVVTEGGTYDPHSSWADHPHNHTEAAWAELTEITAALCRLGETEGVVLAYEPYVNTVLDSAAAARRLAYEIGSPALQFVVDTAGLVTAATLAHNRAVTAAALAALAGRIALAHADDVRYENGKAVWLPLGWGDLDADTFLKGLDGAGYQGALIVEHLAEELVPEALAFCRARLRGSDFSENGRHTGAGSVVTSRTHR